MIHAKNKLVVAIGGPTAIGKTRMAIDLAQHFNSEIISFDSRQFYSEMSIGTAKPSPEELAEIPHHFIGHISIHTPYNGGQFALDAEAKIQALFQKNDIVFLVGGSGLYCDALLNGFDELPEIPASFREELNHTFAEKGLEFIQNLLLHYDPEYHAQVDRNNPQRIIRALEVCMATGKPFSSYRKNAKEQKNYTVLKLALDMDREVLYNRINQRVDSMLANGLIAEVESLSQYRPNNALKTVGYSELFDVIDGKSNLDTATDLIKQNTRRYAKRQLTWLRRDPENQWFEPSQLNDIIKAIELKLK